MSRVDVMVGDLGNANNRSCGQSNRIVRTAAGAWYRFFISGGDADVYYQKSTNYGLTWSVPVAVAASITAIGIAVWFDKWTTGDSGTIVHVTWMDTTNHDVTYRTLDTASDTLGTAVVVFNGASLVAGANTCLSITKSVAGRILIAFDGDGGGAGVGETGFYKSDDYPPTAFTVKLDLNEALSTDYYQIFPGNDADTADIYALFVDRSAGGFSLKVYDDSLNVWGETAIIADGGITALASTTAAPNFAGAVRNSDGHLMAAIWTATDTANADLRFFDINGAASITEKTNVVLNSTDDQGLCAVQVDTTADAIRVFYCGKSDGSETWQTSLGVYYKTSTDGGTTWGSETTLSTTVRARAILNCSLETDTDDMAVEYTSTGVWPGGLFAGSVSAFYADAGGGGMLVNPGMSGRMV